MKKIIFAILFSTTLIGCKTQSVTNTKLDNKLERTIKGSWVISAVTYPGQDMIKVNAFEIADTKCFVNSAWSFISNNNKGKMALTSANCPTFASEITWFINQEGQFVMKMLSEGIKSKKVREGYVLRVANVSENAFQLIDKINVGAKPTDLIYQFTRIATK